MKKKRCFSFKKNVCYEKVQMNTNTCDTDTVEESRKGYWTNDEPRGIAVRIVALDEKAVRISLSSEHWYRVQHFDIEGSPNSAWRLLIDVIGKQCGRSLKVVHAEGTANAAAPTVDYYQVGNLNAKQVDQLYYLLKHTLTTAGVSFSIAHSFTFNTSVPGIPFLSETSNVAGSKRNRRKRRHPLKAAENN
jgi:hypothetical protein